MKDDSLSDVCDYGYRLAVDKAMEAAKANGATVHPRIADIKRAIELTDSVGKQDNVYAKQIWNDAIEAAAKCVEQANRDGPYQAIVAHREIRKLKK